MFTKTKSYIDDLEVLTYKNIHSENAFSIVPGFGALITSLELGGENILDRPKHAELAQNPAFKSSLLAPFANRVNHGIYSFKKQTYHLPVNEKARDNAIHGFIYKQNFGLINETITSDHVSIELKSNYNGDQPGYPFPFETYFKVELDEEDGLSCTLRFVNTGHTEMPLVAGWHPYYSLNADVNQLLMKLPPGEIIEVNDRMIPTGNLNEYNAFDQLTTVGDKNFDNIFKLKSSHERAKIILKNPETGITLEVWQEPELFKYWIIYTPPGRKSIAIEPMSGNIDAFNNKAGLVVIEPGAKVSGQFGVKRAG